MKKRSKYFKLALGLFVFISLAAVGSFVIAKQTAYNTPGNPANHKSVEQGKVLYVSMCAECHGVNLEGQANWDTQNADGSFPAPPHDVSGHTWHHDDMFIFEYIKTGGTAMNPPQFVSDMPKYSEYMTDSEVWAVLAYIKSTWPEHIQAKQANH